MAESIKITNFLGLPPTEINLCPITIVIGPQASGKSVLAKLTFFFREFPLNLLAVFEDDMDKRGLDELIHTRFEEYFLPNSWGNNAFEIRYTAGEHWIEVRGLATGKASSLKLEIVYSEWYATEFRKLKKAYKRELEKAQKAEEFDHRDPQWQVQGTLYEHVQENFPINYPIRQTFVPAGRAFFSILQSGIFTFLSSNNAIDPFLKRFGAYYENTKRSVAGSPALSSSKKREMPKEIGTLIQEIICGEYSRDKGKEWLKVAGDRKISLASASSGQQEALPLALILKADAARGRGLSRSLVIEEPEAHLFPQAQRKIVELITATYAATKGTAQFFITTHSPFVLTAFNNIAYASRLNNSGDKAESKKAKQVFPEALLLPEDDIICAYSLTSKECKSIMNKENGIIDENLIDEVSSELAVQFDALIS